MPNTIRISGEFQQFEDIAHEEIYPGMLLELNSDDEVAKHGSAGDYAERAFAIEDALQGKTVDDAYAAASIVTYVIPTRGSRVLALLESGHDYAIGDKLISAGDGTLQPMSDVGSDLTAAVLEVIAICMETVSLDDSGDADTLVEVRIV